MARKFTKAEIVAKAQKKVGGLKPDVKEAVLSAVKEAYDRWGIGIIVSQGYRTFAEQDALYAQGRTKPGSIVTNAKGGQSNHNYGVAVDFAIDTIDDGKIDSWQPSALVVNMMKRRGFDWGGDWKSFTDLPHFEACDWYRGERNYKVDKSVWSDNTLNIKITNKVPLMDSKTFKGKVITSWTNGTEIQVRKHSEYWYETTVTVKGVKKVGYIYVTMFKQTGKKANGNLVGKVNAFAYIWDNQELRGGTLTYKSGTLLKCYKPLKNGLYPMWIPSKNKMYYTPRFMFDIV